MFKSIFGFFGDILKQVIIKLLTFLIVIVCILFALKYFLGVDVLGFVV